LVEALLGFALWVCAKLDIVACPLLDCVPTGCVLVGCALLVVALLNWLVDFLGWLTGASVLLHNQYVHLVGVQPTGFCGFHFNTVHSANADRLRVCRANKNRNRGSLP